MSLIKTDKEIKLMREGGLKLADIFDILSKEIKPGVKIGYLEDVVDESIIRHKAKPAFKGYKADRSDAEYPSSICACVNEQIVHVAPERNRVLKEGDIITIDAGLIWSDLYLDKAITYGVGNITFEAQRFLRVGKKALKLGVRKAKEGNTTGDIGNTIQRYVESQGYSIIREFCGHGIGKKLHEGFNVYNFGKRKTGVELKNGMTFCVEPIISMGSPEYLNIKNGFGYITKDGSLACHFEDTIAIVKGEPLILTSKV